MYKNARYHNYCSCINFYWTPKKKKKSKSQRHNIKVSEILGKQHIIKNWNDAIILIKKSK